MPARVKKASDDMQRDDPDAGYATVHYRSNCQDARHTRADFVYRLCFHAPYIKQRLHTLKRQGSTKKGAMPTVSSARVTGRKPVQSAKAIHVEELDYKSKIYDTLDRQTQSAEDTLLRILLEYTPQQMGYTTDYYTNPDQYLSANCMQKIFQNVSMFHQSTADLFQSIREFLLYPITAKTPPHEAQSYYDTFRFCILFLCNAEKVCPNLKSLVPESKYAHLSNGLGWLFGSAQKQSQGRIALINHNNAPQMRQKLVCEFSALYIMESKYVNY